MEIQTIPVDMKVPVVVELVVLVLMETLLQVVELVELDHP